MFIAKDGFLLYYGEKTNPNAMHFDTKPKVRDERTSAGHSRRARTRLSPAAPPPPPGLPSCCNTNVSP